MYCGKSFISIIIIILTILNYQTIIALATTDDDDKINLTSKFLAVNQNIGQTLNFIPSKNYRNISISKNNSSNRYNNNYNSYSNKNYSQNDEVKFTFNKFLVKSNNKKFSNSEENKYLKILPPINNLNENFSLNFNNNNNIKNSVSFININNNNNNNSNVPLIKKYNKNLNYFINKNQIRQEKQRKRRQISAESLCQNECVCTEEHSFLNVECEFFNPKQYIINRTKFIPPRAKYLKIVLGSTSKLRIEDKSFNKLEVNSLVIEGTRNGKEHLEINENAFNGNQAVFLKINITNISTVIFRHKAFSNNTEEKHEFVLHVKNANEVIIFKEAFLNTAFHGTFSSIKDLRIQPRGFFGTPESVITIESSKIDTFGKLESAIKEIQIINSEINEISKEAFNVIHLMVLRFQNCKIGVIESHVFTSKLYGKTWEFIGCQIGTIKSNAIDQSGVQLLKFEKNKILSIEEDAISVTAVKLSFSHNEVTRLGTQWLSIKSWDNVTIFNNTFGFYNTIVIDKTPNPVQCIFEKNSITKPQAGSLALTNPNCKIKEIYFYNECTCKLDWIDKLSHLDLKRESFCRIEETLKICFNASVFNVQTYIDEVCGTKPIIDCLVNQNKKKNTSENFLEPSIFDEENNNINQYIYIGLGCIAILILLLIIILTIATVCCRRRPLTIPLSEMSVHNNQNTLSQMKNSKSFSSDDRAIINQTLEIMKNKHSREKYDQVYNNTIKLLEGNLTESEKVLTIGEIVRTIEDCQNSGEDFVAFTGILYKHLAPKDSNQNDPVYAEPALMRDELPTIPDLYNRNDDDGQTMLDHIYAEPNSVQQPLLTNEYATPHDRNEVGGLYSEPIINEREKTVITPYAIGNQRNIQTPPSSSILNINNLPSTSKNLPDVLSQSTKQQQQQKVDNLKLPQTNNSKVKQLAENFANNPNFHITRSPTTNRKIPQYTIPNKLNAPMCGNTPYPDEIDCAAGASVSCSPYLTKNNSNNNNNDTDSTNSHSDHSGGSDITFKIDEIEYADA